jgi:hypothetical protein
MVTLEFGHRGLADLIDERQTQTLCAQKLRISLVAMMEL